ncbi:hypothetical protein LINGRAHAP2_LOCUS1834 [Linum grandiflorum]
MERKALSLSPSPFSSHLPRRPVDDLPSSISDDRRDGSRIVQYSRPICIEDKYTRPYIEKNKDSGGGGRNQNHLSVKAQE